MAVHFLEKAGIEFEEVFADENAELAKGLALVLTDTPQTGEELAEYLGVSKQKVVALLSKYLVEGEDYIKEEVKAKSPSGKSTKKTVYKAVAA